MWHVLDLLLVVLVVLICGTYVVYSLSSIRIKRILLSWLVRCFGLRVFSVLSPRPGGCDNCDAGKPNLQALQKNVGAGFKPALRKSKK